MTGSTHSGPSFFGEFTSFSIAIAPCKLSGSRASSAARRSVAGFASRHDGPGPDLRSSKHVTHQPRHCHGFEKIVGGSTRGARASAARITGMRSWNRPTIPLASVVMRQQVRSRGAPSPSGRARRPSSYFIQIARHKNDPGRTTPLSSPNSVSPASLLQSSIPVADRQAQDAAIHAGRAAVVGGQFVEVNGVGLFHG